MREILKILNIYLEMVFEGSVCIFVFVSLCR